MSNLIYERTGDLQKAILQLIDNLSASGSSGTGADAIGYTPPGAGAVTTTVAAKLAKYVDVSDFGAKGDGVTDDASAIQAAIDYAISLNAPAKVYFPSGKYLCSTTITVNPTLQASSQVMLLGDGIGASVIACKAGFTATKLLHYGAAAGSTSRATFGGINNLSFDGSNISITGAISCVYLFNCYRCNFFNLSIDNFGSLGAYGDGIASYGNVNAPSQDPLNQANSYINIYARNNGLYGIYMRGEKSSIFDLIVADGNGQGGIWWDSESITGGSTETTECVIGSCLSKNNNGPGFAISGASKLSAANLEAYINGGPGVMFQATRSGTNVPSGSCSIGSIVSRNNFGAVASTLATANVYLTNSDIGSIVHIGGKGLGVSNFVAEGVLIVGWLSCTIGRICSELNIGTAVRVIDQTSQNTNAVSIGEMNLYSNGNAVTGTNHGISIEGNASNVTVGRLFGQNAYTSSSSYEINCASSIVGCVINNATLTAASAGNELSIAGAGIKLGGTFNYRGTVRQPLATVANSAAITTVDTYVTTPFQIPSGYPVPGQRYRISVEGTCTNTGANIAIFTIRLGPNGTTADSSPSSLSVTGANGGPIAFKVIAEVGVDAATTFSGQICLLNQGVTGVSNAAVVVGTTGTTGIGAGSTNLLGMSVIASAGNSITINRTLTEYIL